MGLLEFTKNNILVLDGAMGTMLQQNGLGAGENPEVLNITSPEVVKNVHLAYLKSGSGMVLTNTFGANAHKLSSTGYSPEEVITHAAAIAKEAVKQYNGFVALDIGPIGELLEPMGMLTFEDAYELFKAQVIAGQKAGVDAVYIETMTDLYELKCAVLAAKENSNLPVFCTMSFEQNMRTFTGTSISSMAVTLEGLGVDFIGINCSLGPVQMYPMVQELVKWTNLPIIIKPNAGLPNIIDGRTTYDVNPSQFAQEMSKIIDLGVSVVGGCCGTNPEFIKALKEITARLIPAKRKPVDICAVCTPSKIVTIDRVRIIGERINPTGKKNLQQALIKNDLDYVVTQAIEQTEAGADILDINVGLPEIDETEVMKDVVKSVQSIVNTPLQIDSSNPHTIEAALRVYNGKAIVNSVNGDDEILDKVLPLAKKYGASVVGLTLNSDGIPKTAEERFKIAEKIVQKAAEYGIQKNDVFIDCLTLTASAEQKIAFETIKAVKMVKENLGVKTVLGISNISFGLPAREKMNQFFLAAALANGLDLPIMNPNSADMTDTVYCFNQLTNIDAGSQKYIERFGNISSSVPSNTENDIAFCIKSGLKDETKSCCEELLKNTDGLTVAEQFLIPVLDEIGKDYENNKIFLPQLLQSAEAAKVAFELVRKSIDKEQDTHDDIRKKIILATVEGDIHDIGKNIVKVILENYGYSIIDLGRDVKVQKIVDETIKNNVNLVGLSALMTTTLSSMEITIKALKDKNSDIKVMVGGAVLTEEYAKQIGADFYACDAMSSVAIARKVFD